MRKRPDSESDDIASHTRGKGCSTMALKRQLYAKYGGVHFVQTAPAQDINDFVRSLPADKRDSLFEVLHELDEAGLIEIRNDENWTDPYGEIHPAHPHGQQNPDTTE